MAIDVLVELKINSATDIVEARRRGKAMAADMGFSSTDITIIATAISELARNLIVHAKMGEMTLRAVTDGRRERIIIIAKDKGPGIADVDRAVRGGFSTAGGLGMGLSGVRRLMDEFDIQTALGNGTTVTVAKWRR
ncbi:MAG: anti-sigma regulatory factor [Chloroflexi bacterium]|nr:anti-sigma regulatory factor [Chloroflexota bacterium]